MDLQPGTDYCIRVSALVNQIKVRDAPIVDFRTDACAPDTPLPPKLQNRTRNSLLLRWSSPADNGSPINHYVLECDDGNEQYSEAYRGRNKQFAISKLQSSTCYAIRLAACNEIGTSGWSQVLKATTMGAPPPPPNPPTLRSATAKQLNLIWTPSSADMLYTLQMADPDSGHGFLNVYHGLDNEYICTGLTRSTAYRFRVSPAAIHWLPFPPHCFPSSTCPAPDSPRINLISFHIIVRGWPVWRMRSRQAVDRLN